jgi:hypothetical protein
MRALSYVNDERRLLDNIAEMQENIAELLELDEVGGELKMWIGYSLDEPYTLTSDPMFQLLRKKMGKRKTSIFNSDGKLYSITFIRGVHNIKESLPPAIFFRKIAPPENFINHR